MIGIIDYQMGNIQSVVNAFHYLNEDALVIQDAQGLATVDRIVLPGVGAFGRGMEHLKEQGLVDALNHEVVNKKKPFLGICLGMQLICKESFEFGHFQGLGWIPASVRRFETELNVRVPHIGWNNLSRKCESSLITSDIDGKDVYFVHSFYVDALEADFIAASCTYGREFAAAIAKDNIFAVQFHPEKSQKTGLTILKNFAGLKTKCLSGA